VRNDSGFETGSEVPVHYDSMLAKLVTWGASREEARERMRRALDEYVLEGIATNLSFHRWALAHPEFIAGRLHTGFIEEHFGAGALAAPDEAETLARIATIAAHAERERPAGARRNGVGAAGAPQDPLAPRPSAWKRGRRLG
jgi:acetyl-CoA carboxylase biotin carboxylase subunit